MSAAPILAALGDESRLQIVRKLCARGPLSITKLADGAEISRQGVTKHLHAYTKSDWCEASATAGSGYGNARPSESTKCAATWRKSLSGGTTRSVDSSRPSRNSAY